MLCLICLDQTVSAACISICYRAISIRLEDGEAVATGEASALGIRTTTSSSRCSPPSSSQAPPLPRRCRASLHSDLPCPPPPFLIRLLHALLPVFLPDRPFSACFRVRQRASRRSPFRILLSRAHPTSLCAFAGITIYDNEASFTGQPSGTDGVLIGVTGLEALFTNIYGAEGADVKIREIRSLMYNLVKEYQQSPEDVCTSAVSSTSIQNSGIGEDEVFNIFDQHMSSQPANSSSHVRTELDLYLEEPTVNRTQDLDIVNWWKYGGIKYPTLQRIASDLMAIPVTSVASESVFSTGGRIISPHRSRLAPKVVEALMSMQAWSRAEMLGDDNPAIAAMMTCLNDEEESLGYLESAVVDC